MERLMDEVLLEVQAELAKARLARNRTPDNPQQMSADVRLQAPQGNTPAAAARDSSNRSWLPGVREDTSEAPSESMPGSLAAHLGSPDESRFVTPDPIQGGRP